MKITDLCVNHIKNPVGYDLSYQTFSWKYEGADSETSALACRVIIARDAEYRNIISDSGFDVDIKAIAYCLKLELEPRTRYYWRVQARLASGAVVESETAAYFETGKIGEPWQGKWIGVTDTTVDCEEIEKKQPSPLIRRSFVLKQPVKSARLYLTGLGLFEGYLNGAWINDGYLAPGFNAYQMWCQYQTLDVTKSLHAGENVFAVLLGAGWYKGRFGVNGGYENQFGKNYHLLYELHVVYEDGTEEVIASDGTERHTEGPVRFSNIYDGEDYDATKIPRGWMQPGFDDSGWKLAELLVPEHLTGMSERFSIPVVVKEERKPVKLLVDPDGNKILDMGQNMTGWLVFKDCLKPGQKVQLKYAEHMQDGRICTTNLLNARAEFNYVSDGAGSLVRPHFTYFGFRYVQIEGFPEDIGAEDFTGWSMYSDMTTTGWIQTGNRDINQLISNAFWSQKDNFLEHPSDCPQRSERLGWTGDAQMYCQTACFSMDTAAFFRKYMKDVNEAQAHGCGIVPFIVPQVKGRGFEEPDKDVEGNEADQLTEELSSAAWSDVATILPWALYTYYGDKNLLEEEYPGMKAWVDYVIRKDEETGDKKLWQTGFHFGDWLALDNPEPGPFGLTDKYYIASCYYYYSTNILAKAAAVLGKKEDAKKYGSRAKEIRDAIRGEYLDENQVAKQDTQTSYILAIYMEIAKKSAWRANGEKLVQKILANGGHLDTGFVGTVYICLALSKAGFDKEAYDLLFQEGYPSWLYQVKHGATTVWESWDALDESGHLTGTSSLNHYAFGSIVEWLYRESCGIHPMEEYPGFEKVVIAPKPDRRLGYANAKVDSGAGTYRVAWKYGEGENVELEVEIPYGGSALLQMEAYGIREELTCGQYRYSLSERRRKA